MTEKILDIIKIIMVNHLIPTIVAIIPTAFIIYITPEDNAVLIKLGKNFYFITVISLFFLIIKFITYIYKKMENNICYYKQKMEYNKMIEKENVENLFDIIDSFSPENRNLLQYFLDHNNKPIIVLGNVYGNELLSYYCNSNDFIVSDSETVLFNYYTLAEETKLKKGTRATRYKLKDEFFNSVKTLYKKYGKISRF